MTSARPGKWLWPRIANCMSGAVVVNPSFQPAWGKLSALSMMAGRTIVRTTPLDAATSCSPRLLV